MFNSQFGEDQYIEELLPETGYFVDVGAGNPRVFSNTRYFEDKGWDGLCIDADPLHYAELVKERKNVFYSAVRSFDGISPFSASNNPDYSRIGEEIYSGKKIQVPCFTLDTLLMHFRVRHIDLLSIDVEGAELEALEGLSLERYKPTVIIIEYKTIGVADNESAYKQYFQDKPYKLIQKTESNLIFYRQ